jgi:hypothetical protein
MALALLLMMSLACTAAADEGMWLFNRPPLEILKSRYGFEPPAGWLTHVQQASVRFNSGGSGSFVSADGLVMTNHHIASDALQKLSTPQRDYLKSGFHAKTQEQELKCLDLELNVLVSIEDVTPQVQGAAQPGMSPAEAFQARQAVMNTIEKQSADKTGLRSDVVTLYHGAEYHLYRYRKYTDVRLVFAPEVSVAFFGGDPDNFEYLRYDLDVSFFRVYENGKPARPPHYLKWSASGAGEGELVFVSGDPGRTDRLDTLGHLEFYRDRIFPYALRKIYRAEVLLSTYSQRSLENARRAKEELFIYQNSRKARVGGLQSLQDPAVMGQKAAEEKALRDAVAKRPELQAADSSAWDEVNAALRGWDRILTRWDLLEVGSINHSGSAFNSRLFCIARTLLRQAEETAKPNAKRLREFRDSNLESLRQELYSEAPIYADLEMLQMADSLSMLEELMGADDPLVKSILAGRSPIDRAAELVEGSKLASVELRKKLAAEGLKAIEASTDPMLRLARLVDGPAREVRKTYEDSVEEPLRQAYTKIAHARFAVQGTATYPDATFTLRLSFGTVRGYTELGKTLPAWTTIGGAFQWSAEHANRDPFELPESWLSTKDQLNLDTPLNFVLTADIVGGNSGSPVINRAGSLVGIIFDGNLPSLGWDFVYSDQVGRAIAVDSRGIVEALRKVYHADRLVDELMRSAGGSQ